jgi:class 3 adenylate cyclase
MTRGLSPGALTALWVGSLAVSIGASILSATVGGRPPEIFLPIGVASAVYATTGFLMARRRPDNRIGHALIAIGAVQAGLVVFRYLVVWTEVFNVALGPASSIILAWVLLAFPTGSLAGRAERVTMWAATAAVAVLGVVTIFTLDPTIHPTSRCPPCEPNPLRITDDSVFFLLDPLRNLAFVLISLAVTVLCVRRWWLSHGAGRRLMAPVLFGGIVYALGVAAVLLVSTGIAVLNLGAQLLLALQVLVPIGLAATFLLVYAARSAVSGAVVQLGASPRLEALEDALRRALHDPGLTVARWSATSSAYLDREGARVDVGGRGAGRDVIHLETDGRPVAAVIHDGTLAVEPALVASVADAVRFAVDTADLRDQLHARGGDVANLPRGEVTFLFGDLEGSTALLSRLGDAYVDLLAELRRIVRDVADRHRGRVVDARADECFLAFADPLDALTGAAELQRRLFRATWPNGARPRMRMGLHLGTPELTADGYVGIDVHRAARIMGAAHGGQIMASAPLAVAAGDHLPEGLSLTPIGYQSLKGIPEPEFLYRVAGAGLS